MDGMTGVFSVEEVAEKLGYTKKTLMHYLYTNHPIKSYFTKIGRNWVLTEDNFYHFIEDQPLCDEQEEE